MDILLNTITKQVNNSILPKDIKRIIINQVYKEYSNNPHKWDNNLFWCIEVITIENILNQKRDK